MRSDRPQFTVRNLMGVVAITAVLFGGVIGMNELDRRADHLRKEAEYHRRSEQSFEAEAAYLESLASDPSREAEIPLALFKRKRWSQGQALEMVLESAVPFVDEATGRSITREAFEMALESAVFDRFCGDGGADHRSPVRSPSLRWKQLASEAKRVATQDAQAHRTLSEYHARQRRRYERASLSLWPPVELDQPPREP
jgi:hypothetical protein